MHIQHATAAPAGTRTDTALPERDLIAKYRGAGPRYTSYPTALQFDSSFDENAYRVLLREARSSVAPLSLYVHLPFCRWLCYYCACNKIVTKKPGTARQYLDYLGKEMDLLASQIGGRRPVTQLHLGGGTPTYLSDAELTELVHMLATHFRLDDDSDREYAIEIDPRTVDGNRLALLRGLGFNRLSFGVQDSNADVQAAVNRVCDIATIRALIEQARVYRFRSISVDLIYGLPVQTVESMGRTIDDIIAIRPDRIALYHYAHLPQQFPAQRAIERHQLPSSDEKLTMLTLAGEKLVEAGYVHIGMDHFSVPEDNLARSQQCGRLQRNFQGYSSCLAPDVLAMGVSSISSLGGHYAQNHKSLDDYYHALDQNRLPIARGLRCSADDGIRAFVINEMICNLILDFDRFHQRCGSAFSDYFSSLTPALNELEQDGLIERDARALRVTECGRRFLRNICMVFDAYLGEQPHAFSKTL